MLKPIKKFFEIQITAANQSITKSFQLDKNIKAVKGLLLLSDKDDLLYYRGGQKIEINNEEIFPERYASKLLMTGINVPLDGKYCSVNVNPGNGSVKVVFQDSDDGRTVFAPYTVFLYLAVEMEDAV